MSLTQNLSQFKVIRLNCDLFPMTPFEQQAYDQLGIKPTGIEASGAGIVLQAADCDALVVVSESLPAEVIDQLTRCRVISRLGAGTDKIDRDAATRNGIVMTNVPNFCYEEQADHAMALLLSLVRKLPQMDAAMRAGSWDSGRATSRSIRRFDGRVLGLVGFGGSAKALARRARGFGLRIIACRGRAGVADPDAASLGVHMTDLDTVLGESDYVSLHLPLNEQTHGLIDAARLAAMKPGAYLINTARGAIVDEASLAEAIGNGHLAGAGIDVFHEISVHGPDGSPPSHPLLDFDNVIVTPHVAAFSVDSSRDVGTGGVANLAAVLSGSWPPSDRVVNPEVKPKWALRDVSQPDKPPLRPVPPDKLTAADASSLSTILVTGGAGFIGSCFVRHLIGEGAARVINFDKLTYAGNLDSLDAALDDPLHQFVEGDVGDREAISHAIISYQPDAIVHFAAESHVDRSIDGPSEFVQTNVVGTFTLLEAARQHWEQLSSEKRAAWRFVHVSTDEVYGSLDEPGRFSETSAFAPNSPYAASKAAGDHFARAYYQTYGLPVLISNCSNNYGPYQFPEKLIPLMLLNALEGHPLPVYGDGQQVRDWLFVEDHCRGLRLVLERGTPGETYNLGGDSERSNLDVVCSICQLVDELQPDLPHLPCSSLITHVADRPGHDRRYAIDATKARETLGWQPQLDFETGLRSTVQWYLEHPAWVQRVTSGVYRRERLGLSQ